MSTLDWIVLFGTLLFIVFYGVYKTRGSKDMHGYLKGGNTMKWWMIGLSVMATQASAITFLSTPGQAYDDGMRFVQFYFGLPIAMIILSVTVIPAYYRLKVYTAYEYLESRFDLKTRSLTAFFFLIGRGLAAGVTIYAPAIILSTILGWHLNNTCLLIGVLVIIYTVSGGTLAVSQTQKYQMAVMMGGMLVAGVMVVVLLPEDVSFGDAMNVAGNMNKLNAVDFSFNLNDRYNFWSGITGGLFIALSYFGFDQSQVSRYLGGKSVAESRLGLLMNGLLKVPMQFLILFIGAMVFVFYQFYQPPVFFNESAKEVLYQSEYAEELQGLESEYAKTFQQKEAEIREMLTAIDADNASAVEVQKNKISALEEEGEKIRSGVKDLITKADPKAETNDTDYVFITFVMDHLPKGVVGLLLAVIFSAAMSSTSSELNALASTTAVDIYKRSIKPEASGKHYVVASKLFTVFWGGMAILFAMYASLFENLIEFINILGSLFYGTILGVFLVAFYIKYIQSNAVFIAAILAEIIVIIVFRTTDISFLWYNVIGCGSVVGLGFFLQFLLNLSDTQSRV